MTTSDTQCPRTPTRARFIFVFLHLTCSRITHELTALPNSASENVTFKNHVWPPDFVTLFRHLKTLKVEQSKREIITLWVKCSQTNSLWSGSYVTVIVTSIPTIISNICQHHSNRKNPPFTSQSDKSLTSFLGGFIMEAGVFLCLTWFNTVVSLSLFSFSLSWKLKGLWIESKKSLLCSWHRFLSFSFSSIISRYRIWLTWPGTGWARNFLWHSVSASSSLLICVVLVESKRSHCWVLAGGRVETLTEQLIHFGDIGAEDTLGLGCCNVFSSDVRADAEVALLIATCLKQQ